MRPPLDLHTTYCATWEKAILHILLTVPSSRPPQKGESRGGGALLFLFLLKARNGSQYYGGGGGLRGGRRRPMSPVLLLKAMSARGLSSKSAIGGDSEHWTLKTECPPPRVQNLWHWPPAGGRLITYAEGLAEASAVIGPPAERPAGKLGHGVPANNRCQPSGAT